MPPNKKHIRIFAHSNHYLLLVEVYYYAKNRLGFTMVGKPASFNSSNFFLGQVGGFYDMTIMPSVI